MILVYIQKALLHVSVYFRYRRDAFRGVGGEPRSHLSRCSEQESTVFRYNHFFIKPASNNNRAIQKTKKM